MLVQKIEEHIEAMGPFGFSMFQHFSFCCKNAIKIPKLRPTTNVFIVFRKELSISPPARWGYLDSDKGTTPLPSSSSPRSPPSSSSTFFASCFCQLQMLRGTPGPEHHMATSGCCGGRLISPAQDRMSRLYVGKNVRWNVKMHMPYKCHIYFQMDPDSLSETMSE